MKAGNTLDTVIAEGGRSVVRHYLQDVGSTFGVGANGPHDWNEGWEHVYDGPPSHAGFLTFGFELQPVADGRRTSVSRPSAASKATTFEPETWKPRAPTAAYYEMRDDDAFWAARRVMAFSDDADPRGGEDRAVQRSEGGAVPRRRADQAARQDRPRLPHEDQPDRRSRARRHRRADVRQRGRGTWLRDGARRLCGRVVRVRQRDRRFAPDRADDGRPGPHAAAVGVAAARPAHTSASISRPITRSIRAGSSRSGPTSCRQAAGWKLVGLERQGQAQ